MNTFRSFADIDQAEKSLIGSAIIQPNRIDQLAAIVQPKHFKDPELGRFWASVIDFRQAEKPMDVVTMLPVAKRIWGDDGSTILGELFTFVPYADHASYYASLVIEAYRIRNYKRIATGILNRVSDVNENPDSIEQWLNEKLDDSIDTSSRRSRSAYEFGVELLNEMNEERQAAIIETGIFQVDRDVCGFAPGELIILAARPANCKTAFAIQIADYAAQKSQPVLYLSLEMTGPELLNRLLCGRCGIDSRKVRSNDLSQDEKRQLHEANNEQKELPFYIDDPSRINLQQIQALAKIQKAATGLSLLVVDYIGLIDAGNSKSERREQVAEWSRSLKRLAKELQIPVLVLVQLNRATDQQNEPRLSNLAESASLEQDADVVMFLHREKQNENRLELLVAKHRHADLSRHELFLNVNTMQLEIDR